MADPSTAGAAPRPPERAPEPTARASKAAIDALETLGASAPAGVSGDRGAASEAPVADSPASEMLAEPGRVVAPARVDENPRGQAPADAAEARPEADSPPGPVPGTPRHSTILNPGCRDRPLEVAGVATGKRSRQRAMVAAMAVAGALAAAAGTLVGISIAGGTSSHHNGRTTTASSSDALNAKLNRARSGPQYSVRSTVTVGHEPLGVAVADGTVWVANSPLSGNHPNGTVSRINAATGTVIGRPIPVPNGPFQIAAGNGSVWVTTLDGQVTRINATTGAVVGHPILEYQQTGEIDTIDVADGTVWVANSPLSGERTVSRINASTGALIGHPIPLGSQPSTALNDGITVADRTVWVVTAPPTGRGTVSRINATTGSVIGDPIPVGDNGPPEYPVIAETNGTVWVTNSADNTVSRINATTGTVVGHPIPVGGAPSAIAVGNGSVWVTNSADNTVSVINATTVERVVGHPIPVGHDPDAIAVSDGSVWVANDQDNTVSAIPTAGSTSFHLAANR